MEVNYSTAQGLLARIVLPYNTRDFVVSGRGRLEILAVSSLNGDEDGLFCTETLRLLCRSVYYSGFK